MEQNLYTGHYLKALQQSKDNATLRGEPDPHISSFCKLLFTDYDLESLGNLRRYALGSKGKFSILSFYYVISSEFLKEKHSFLDVKDFKSFLNFNDKYFKVIHKQVLSFIKKPNKKSVAKIINTDAPEDLKYFVIDLCFKYSSLTLTESIKLFPELEDVFSIDENNELIISNDQTMEVSINRGILIQSFISKFHSDINSSSLLLILKSLIENQCYNLHLLNLFLRLTLPSNHFPGNYLDILKDLELIDDKHRMAILHFIQINYLLTNDYNSIEATIPNQITDEVRDTGRFPFNLDDNNDQPYQNLNLHRNARVYLNSIFSLSYYRNKNSNFYSSDAEIKKLCVIGGAHALSWSNISNPSINIDVKFLYTDFFDLTNNKYDFSLIDYSSIASIQKVFVPDAFFFLHNLENQNNVTDKTMLNTQEYLTDLISELKINLGEDLTIITIPAPSEKTFSSFDSDLIPEYINAINEAILSNDTGVKYFDINKYIRTSNLFTEDSNLINNYFVKPEFIVKLIEKDLLS